MTGFGDENDDPGTGRGDDGDGGDGIEKSETSLF